MSKRIKKITQLDSVRAFAAFSVIIFHFLTDYKIGNFPLGPIGVDVFFVISGYLITAILLEQKEVITNKLLIIKNFIIKRVLRLFPVYYLFLTFFLILMYAFGLYIWDPGDEIYYYTYTENLLFFKEGMKGMQANHLWTLCVEEQFYLLWPWLAIFVPNRKLIVGLLIVIPLALVVKAFSGMDMEELKLITPVHFDTLGSGALFALLLKEKGEGYLQFVKKIHIPVLLSSLFILILSLSFNVSYFLNLLSVLTLSVSLMVGCYYNFGGVFGRILNTSWLSYLGKISYGLYLYHKPVPYFIKIFALKLNFQINGVLAFIISILITVLIAHFSYQLIEKRFLKLKEKFDL
jgi:peptidoglycan/LPS O-acetylase OafA/YrhL